jgi:hypothetical protein
MIDALRPLPQTHHGVAGVEVEVDRLLPPLRLRREVLERLERLLEAGRRLPVGRALRRLPTGLTEIEHGLLPRLAPERVVCETLDVLGEPLGVEALDGLHGPGVERAAPLLEEASVGHLVGQRVLEDVGRIRE